MTSTLETPPSRLSEPARARTRALPPATAGSDLEREQRRSPRELATIARRWARASSCASSDAAPARRVARRHHPRRKYEQQLGVDLGARPGLSPASSPRSSTSSANAYAVTVGGTGMILMGGSPDRSMASSAGRALLAHELTHVAQARRACTAPVAATSRPPRMATEEHEAEAEDRSRPRSVGDRRSRRGRRGRASADTEKRAEERAVEVFERGCSR